MKFGVFAWPLIGHRQNFGPQAFSDKNAYFCTSNGVMLTFETDISIANEHGHVLSCSWLIKLYKLRSQPPAEMEPDVYLAWRTKRLQ